MKVLGHVLWLSCLWASAEARLRYVRRSPSPSPTPTPTPGCTPSPAPALPAPPGGACSSGRQPFALQIRDCRSALDGQFFKAVVSFADKLAQTPIPAAEQHPASLYTGLQRCAGVTQPAAGDCGGVLPAQPTLFYLDAQRNLYVDPLSPLGANGSYALGRRLSLLPIQSGHGVDVMTPPQLFVSGSAEEAASHAAPLACSIAQDSGAFACAAKGKAKLSGTLSLAGPLVARVRGYNINFAATDLLWQENCINKHVCGHWTIQAVPACP